ncbi:uncharacterized protein N7506_005631 [Penicillium brevicompactum]|uniref:uncharacterized protein n=1 Tax=Penicillium brevicompactum TaxID=5074 RepID=UPI0025416AFE|nr:uncharacterized protein N7506_005631 [Penicillium brevicompactum]KAJ5335695.1 hypothetical protein N7506_005631 [Penicillium brevicompactum]
MYRSPIHLNDQRGRRAREDQPTVIGVGEERELGRRRVVWLRIATVPRRLGRGQGNLPRGHLFPHRPANHGRRLGRLRGPAPASVHRASATRVAGARPPALGRLARRPVAASGRVTAQEAQGAFFPPVLTEGIGHFALDDQGPVPSAHRVVVMFIRGRGEVGEEEQSPPAPELVRQAHVPAPGAQPLGETGGQRRLDPGRDQLRLDQKATDLRRVADARDLLVDEFHEEAQEQPRADVVDRDLGVETVQQADDRVQHGTRGARGRGLCDRVEEGVGVGGPVPDDRLHLGAEVPGAPIVAQLVDQPVLALASAGRGLPRRAGVPVVAQAIELVQLGRELFGPDKHAYLVVVHQLFHVVLVVEHGCQDADALADLAEGHGATWREEGGGRKNSIERGADGGYDLYHGGRVGGHLEDTSRLSDVSGQGRTRSTRATTLDTSVVVGDDSPTRAPSEAGPTVS